MISVVNGVGQERHDPGPLYLDSQRPLMTRAGSRDPSGKHLAPFSYIILHQACVLVVDLDILVFTEPACLPLIICTCPWISWLVRQTHVILPPPLSESQQLSAQQPRERPWA